MAILMTVSAAMAVRMQAQTRTHRVWQRSVFTLTGIADAENPYDPDCIAVDVTITAPSGTVQSVPAFWYQPYTRQLVGVETMAKDGENAGKPVKVMTEQLTPAGSPGWRLHYTPAEVGRYRYRVTVTVPGTAQQSCEGHFTVKQQAKDAHGFVRIEPTQARYFKLDDGTPLPLLGLCGCWHGKRGTYDYDDWFTAYAQNGINYTRLWMWPRAFGIEGPNGKLVHYNQQAAWQLDYVLDLAAAKGIYIMLCLDYHGFFEAEPITWAGNDWWPKNPYNAALGGPCATQNDFFTGEAVRKIYEKRLRYLIARYGADTSLMSWQFFNEINNEYRNLKPADVASWHGIMAKWMHEHDPYRHLVTTSLGSAGDQPELWRQPDLDYTLWHWYKTWGGGYSAPVAMALDVTQRFRARDRKPFYIGEFGISGLGPTDMLIHDPGLRGLHQGIWGGLFAGSAGTAMPWWWEWIYAAKQFNHWHALRQLIAGTGFGSAAWHPGTATPVTAGLDAYSLTDDNMALLWVLDHRYNFPNGSTGAAEECAGGTVQVHGLPDGEYEVEWIDTLQGTTVARKQTVSTQGIASVAIPAFHADIAARIRPVR